MSSIQDVKSYIQGIKSAIETLDADLTPAQIESILNQILEKLPEDKPSESKDWVKKLQELEKSSPTQPTPYMPAIPAPSFPPQPWWDESPLFPYEPNKIICKTTATLEDTNVNNTQNAQEEVKGSDSN